MLLLIKRHHPNHICHISFLPLYPQPITLYPTVSSDKQPISQGDIKTDVLHTDRHADCAYIEVTPAASLSTAPTFVSAQFFGTFVFKISL
jgi:hypothetical protein